MTNNSITEYTVKWPARSNGAGAACGCFCPIAAFAVTTKEHGRVSMKFDGKDYSLLSFRDVERRFWVLQSESMSEMLLMDEYRKGTKCVLFCYVKPGSCIAFEIVGYENGGIVLFDDRLPRKVYIDTLLDEELTSCPISEAMADRVSHVVEKEYADVGIVASRQISEIDHLRQPYFPDVITVYCRNKDSSSWQNGTVTRVTDEGTLMLRLCKNGQSDKEYPAQFFTAQAQDKREQLVAVIEF